MLTCEKLGKLSLGPIFKGKSFEIGTLLGKIPRNGHLFWEKSLEIGCFFAEISLKKFGVSCMVSAVDHD